MIYKKIYGNTWGFGDLWAECCDAVSSKYSVAFHSNLWGDQLTLIPLIYSVLKTNKKPTFTDNPANIERYLVENHQTEYVPTKINWNAHRSICKRKSNKIKKIVLQIDTPSWHHSDRYFTKEETIEFRKLVIKLLGKIDFIPIGKPKTIPKIIQIASESEMFFGTCSGMSHICHSVGIPVYLKNYSNLYNCHRGKQYTKFDNFKEIIPQILQIAETK